MRWISFSALILFTAACGPWQPSDAAVSSLHPVKVNGHPLQVELAVTPEEQARGLMFRKELPENQGMLFVFEAPRQASFWMKNTLIPLSIAYLDTDGVILEIYDMTPLSTTGITSRSRKVAYALEVNRGWFAEREIAAGQRVTLPENIGAER